ncbi:hypothetical protein L1887_36330 [Cichorium endivia]|nr:hypothetical protein L1887_36330 [Cichorium endivia]
MKELVTFQVGSYANFIGSHFWNFQDELLGLVEDPHADMVFKTQNLDMDVLYRTGETQQGIPTYTPRLISVDIQGSLGSMSSHGTLYNQSSSLSSNIPTWNGNVSTQASKPHNKNLFLQRLYDEGKEIVTNTNGDSKSEILDTDVVNSLEDSVQFWTDYSKVHYHPKSLFELNGSWVDPKEFNNYGIGKNTVSEGQQGDEINERLRSFIEECDHVQGIQFIVDDSGGFSGVSASILESIADDYTNVPVLLYSVRCPNSFKNPKTRKETISSNLHDAVSFSALSSLCKLIIPIGLPSLNESGISQFLNIEDKKLYHSSAVYASVIHSISLPFRMKRIGPSGESVNEYGGMDLYEGIQMLAGQGRQNTVTVLDACIPAPSLTGRRFKQSFLENLHSLTPETAHDVEDLQAIESMIVHGALGSGEQEASVLEVREAVETAYDKATTRPRFSHLSVSRSPIPIPLPFPSIFGKFVGRRGEILSNPVSGSNSRRGSLDVQSIPMAARLRSSTAILPFLENRLVNIKKFGLERGSIGAEVLRNWGFGREEVEEIGENLSKLVSVLDPQQDYSSDDSD